MVISAVYARPQTKIETGDLNKIFNASNSVIAVGDFNAKHTNWNCPHNNQTVNSI